VTTFLAFFFFFTGTTVCGVGLDVLSRARGNLADTAVAGEREVGVAQGGEYRELSGSLAVITGYCGICQLGGG